MKNNFTSISNEIKFHVENILKSEDRDFTVQEIRDELHKRTNTKFGSGVLSGVLNRLKLCNSEGFYTTGRGLYRYKKQDSFESEIQKNVVEILNKAVETIDKSKQTIDILSIDEEDLKYIAFLGTAINSLKDTINDVKNLN